MKALINYSLGDALPMTMTPEGVFEKQTVVRLAPTSEGVILETERQVYLFESHLTMVSFPIRTDTDGKRIINNWCLQAEAPYPFNLAVGDIIDPHGIEMHPRQTEPGWSEMGSDERAEVLADYWLELSVSGEYQVVTALTPSQMEGAVFINTGKHRYLAAMNLPFQQPFMDSMQKHTSKGRISSDEYPRSGRYDSTLTGESVWFAIHSTGRGRYPSYVKRYDVVGDGLMAPPNRAEFRRAPGTSATPYVDEWNKWRLVAGEPHPFDPRQ